MKTLKLSLAVLVGYGILRLSTCTDTQGATQVLLQNGYEQIEITGYDFFSCGEGDFYSTGFKAVKNGKPVSGTVCAGLFKGKTIRYD